MLPWLQQLENELHKSLPDVIEVVSFVLVFDWLHLCYQHQTSTHRDNSTAWREEEFGEEKWNRLNCPIIRHWCYFKHYQQYSLVTSSLVACP